ncbi:hypothetical protein Tco_0790984 [Tanacetum coccineum]
MIDKMDKSESYMAAPEHRDCYEGLKKSYELDKTFFYTYDKVYSLKRSRKDKDKDENLLLDQTLRKHSLRLETRICHNDKRRTCGTTNLYGMLSMTPPQGQNQSWLMTLASSAEKPSNTFDELMSTLIDFSAFIMNGLNLNNLTQETLLGPTFRLLKDTRSNYVELEYDFEECYKALSEKLDWENPEGGDYPFDLTKPYLYQGYSNMILQAVKVMVPNIWVPVKVAYDKHALWGIFHWREQRKSFYGYARGLQSRHDVYSTKRILAVTQVEVMRKHGYGYLKEIVNRLTKLLGDEISDFAIALRMFTRILVIQNRVEDLQLGVKSYQKKINVTRPQTTIFDIKKRDPYTPYQDPQGFIYVNNNGRNRLMRSDELYKFSDRTLTGLQTSLDDITKNIRMEYLPKRRWSKLEKKRANIMIKYEKRSKSENKGKVPTEMELVLEQTQQCTSYEVSVDPYGFEGTYKDGRGVEYGVSTSIGYGVSSSLSNTAYSLKLINTAYPLPLDTVYRSSGTEAESSFSYSILLMDEPILNENTKKSQSESNLSITSNDLKIDFSKEFLVALRKNMYHGTHYEDVVDHIAKVLKMVDLIYVPGVDSHQLRMKVFPLSLVDDAKEWWISNGEEKITTWEELVEKFFCRFYLESYDGEDEMLDEGEN